MDPVTVTALGLGSRLLYQVINDGYQAIKRKYVNK